MPIHDWTKIEAGMFHHFHQTWGPLLAMELNNGRLPDDYFALVEQRADGREPDILAIESGSESSATATAVKTKPKTMITMPLKSSEATYYARRADRIAIHHRRGKVVAMIEIVSPGNKSTKTALEEFVRKAADFLRNGVHLLVVDLFPPGRHDPDGIHQAILDVLFTERYQQPKDKPLTIVSYEAGFNPVAYIEARAPGETLPEMPLFLTEELYVPTPLESSYQAAWKGCPPKLFKDVTP